VGQERRQFYRVEKDVALEVEVVSLEEVSRSIQPSQFEVSPYFELLAEVQELDKQQQDLIASIAQSHPEIAALFNLQAQKLDTITRTLASSGLQINHLTKQTINLSEGGMQCEVNNCKPGDYLAIKLIFSNPLLGVLLYGQVQRIISENTDSQKVAVAFYQMPESCRRLIAQRVLQAQTRHHDAI